MSLLSEEALKLIDSILRKGGRSVPISALKCNASAVQNIYERRGWKVTKAGGQLLFEEKQKRGLLLG